MKAKKRIESDSSLFLDSFRIFAALAVIVDHSFVIWSNNHKIIYQFHKFAHGAVIIFFVLSGYLISYTTTINNRGARQYAVARLSRLYSIAFPSLIITLLIEVFLQYFNPDLLYSYSRGHTLPRYIISMFFCNECGWISAAPPINSPLWSLSYEFWYYAIFGITFFPNIKTKYKAVILFSLFIMLTKILLLMPIWLLGFMAYKLNNSNMSIRKSWITAICLSFISIVLIIFTPDYPFELGSKPFFFSSRFLSDTLIAISFALSLKYIPLTSKYIPNRISKKVRFLGDMSFPIYALHYPIFLLCKTIFHKVLNNEEQIWVSIPISFVIIFYIGIFLEKNRNLWTSFFNYLINKIAFKLKQNKYIINN